MHKEKPAISVVVPLYQAADCVRSLCERLHKSLAKIHSNYEIIIVEDGSTDDSWRRAEEAALQDSRVKAVRFSRNFGQHYAITAGLELSQGDAVVVMDCDLQDAPEDIEKLYKKMQDGYDVVFASQQKSFESIGKRITSQCYHALISVLNGNVRGAASFGNFSILSRKVVISFLKMQDIHRHYLILLRYLGYPYATVAVARYSREKGRSSYSWRKLISLAFDGIIAQSNIFLRWSISIGLASSACAVLFMGRIIYYRFMRPGIPVGWSSLMATLLLIGGLILMSLGILGIYIDKIFTQTKNRPLYVILSTVNNEPER